MFGKIKTIHITVYIEKTVRYDSRCKILIHLWNSDLFLLFRRYFFIFFIDVNLKENRTKKIFKNLLLF